MGKIDLLKELLESKISDIQSQVEQIGERVLNLQNILEAKKIAEPKPQYDNLKVMKLTKKDVAKLEKENAEVNTVAIGFTAYEDESQYEDYEETPPYGKEKE